MKLSSNWNYRVVKSGGGFHVHEVYYSKSGKPIEMSTSCWPSGDTIKELGDDIAAMLAACGRGVFVPPKKWR